jgi:hypothetical protein
MSLGQGFRMSLRTTRFVPTPLSRAGYDLATGGADVSDAL